MYLSFLFSTSIVFSLLFLQICIFRVSGFTCYTRMISTCPDNVITSWNTDRYISDNLKAWFKTLTFQKTTPINYANGKHCKTITIKKNDYFSQMAPEIYSPNITILGKINHADNGKDWNPKRRDFVGPVWVTINDQFEWKLDDVLGNSIKISSELKTLMHNGIYYGTIDNDELNIGKSYKM